MESPQEPKYVPHLPQRPKEGTIPGEEGPNDHTRGPSGESHILYDNFDPTPQKTLGGPSENSGTFDGEKESPFLRLNPRDIPAIVRIRVPGGVDPTFFTVEKDVMVSVVKVGSIIKDLYIEKRNATRLLGIVLVPLATLGTVTLSVGGALHNFQVVPNDFPLRDNGVIGNDFMEATGAVMSRHYGVLIMENIREPRPFLTAEKYAEYSARN